MTEEYVPGYKLVQVPFSGWYNSIHESDLDQTLEQICSDRGSGCTTNKVLLERANEIVVWQKVFMAYNKAYIENMAHEFRLDLKFESMHSPREYNFTTDRLFAYISIKSLAVVRRQTSRENLSAKAVEMFTSRSGFMSFYSPTVADWGHIRTWDYNQLYCLLWAWLDQEHAAHENNCFDHWAEHALMESESCNGNFDEWIWAAMPTRKRNGFSARLGRWQDKMEKEAEARQQLAR